MKKIVKLWKNIPPEMRTLLAMAGLASPFGMVYMLRRYLFPGWSLIKVIMVVFAVVAAICILGFLLAWVFGRGKRKRNKQMANELADEGQAGPVSVDVGAAIKANNDKFFKAVREMRKSFSVNVYDLPWYIVMGDSGCGKTRLVNNGGLTFATGKPEGYQLGTLNYNWWFTEDAVFIDMAGRLCNPQDDADYREWEGFLETIGKGRKGFPINGAIVCVAADHLLQDSPEKHEKDANTALERLRDLQKKLGVTFATYLVITKCDKMLGFMQFFDQASRSIKVKNEIFGWSKPGSFSDLYDPEQFGGDFESLYARLNELRIRRMHDESDEIALGLAYGFPEEFRELREPLDTYVRTIFPKIKNPKAIKNLIFRGVYFTSATQEGALILKNLSARLGEDAASQFAPLDTLYPEKRPLFIKDVLFRKVFPEHGLVFRNENEVVRNRKLAQLLKYGGIAMFVCLSVMLWWSATAVSDLIVTPQLDAVSARGKQQERFETLKHTEVLGDDLKQLEGRAWARRFLSFGVGADKPLRDLTTIRLRLFEEGVLIPLLREVGQVLRGGLEVAPGYNASLMQKKITKAEARKRYLEAFLEYVLWFGCSGSDECSSELTYARTIKFAGVIFDRDYFGEGRWEGFQSEALYYFDHVHEQPDWKNPARRLEGFEQDAREIILASMGTVHEYLAFSARVDEQNTNAVIAEWMRNGQRCATIDDSYGRMLDAESDADSDFVQIRVDFNELYDGVDGSLSALGWKGPGTLANGRIPTLDTAILKQRQGWLDYQQGLRDALGRCDGRSAPQISQAIQALSDGGTTEGVMLVGLDHVLWQSLQRQGLIDRDIVMTKERFDPEVFKQTIISLDKVYPHILAFTEGDVGTPDTLGLTDQAKQTQKCLRELHRRLGDANLDKLVGDKSTPGEWVKTLWDAVEAQDEDSGEPPESCQAVAHANWRPRDLAGMARDHQDLILQGGGAQLLVTMQARLEGANEWGFAELYKNWAVMDGSSVFIFDPIAGASGDTGRTRRGRAREAIPEEEPDEPRRSRRGRRGRSGGRRGGRAVPAEKPERTTSARSGSSRSGGRASGRKVSQSLLASFMDETIYDSAELIDVLDQLRPEDYFRLETENGEALHERCRDLVDETGQAYTGAFVGAWAKAYEDFEFKSGRKFTSAKGKWRYLAKEFGKSEGAMGRAAHAVKDEFRDAFGQFMEAVPFWYFVWDMDRAEWFDVRSDSEDYFEDYRAWMNDALRDISLAQGNRFLDDANVPREIASEDRESAPWQQLGGEFARLWEDLSKSIGANQRLPSRFDSVTTVRVTPIPWGKIQKLRVAAGLDDERLTGKLVAFEELAQRRLNEALVQILVKVQRDSFGSQKPEIGWPYLPGGETAQATLQTVNFDKFTEFLVSVRIARDALAPLERGLSKGDGYVRLRKAFLDSCDEWAEFLKVDEKRADARALNFTIKSRDPTAEPLGKDAPKDGPQHYYENVELDIGSSDKPFRFFTERENMVKTSYDSVWKWPATGNRPLSVKLMKGFDVKGGSRRQRYSDITRSLGESSPLGLPAYLQHYGERNGDDWIVSHSIDLKKEFSLLGQKELATLLGAQNGYASQVGVKFVITLDRELPDPIVPIELPESSVD